MRSLRELGEGGGGGLDKSEGRGLMGAGPRGGGASWGRGLGLVGWEINGGWSLLWVLRFFVNWECR